VEFDRDTGNDGGYSPPLVHPGGGEAAGLQPSPQKRKEKKICTHDIEGFMLFTLQPESVTEID
jgi:hypothetical protein